MLPACSAQCFVPPQAEDNLRRSLRTTFAYTGDVCATGDYTPAGPQMGEGGFPQPVQ